MNAAESVEGQAEAEVGKDGVDNKDKSAADKRQEPSVPEEPQVHIILEFLKFLGILEISCNLWQF